jgi:hypothetical protein
LPHCFADIAACRRFDPATLDASRLVDQDLDRVSSTDALDDLSKDSPEPRAACPPIDCAVAARGATVRVTEPVVATGGGAIEHRVRNTSPRPGWRRACSGRTRGTADTAAA